MRSETAEVLAARYGARLRIYATGTVMLGMISAVLTTTIVNVAIPDIMGAFGIGQDRAQWLSTGALAAMTVGMLLNAWMMTSFGQRRTFIGALCIFAASLILAGASPNESVLVFCRIVQGAVAGLLLAAWSESLPRLRQTAGVAFHFDAPSSRAPQAILLCTPSPDTGYDFALVRDSVKETLNLARLRMVGPETLADLGQFLPATYLPAGTPSGGGGDQ